MAKLSISKAWDETREVTARDGSLLTTIGLALFVLPGVVADIVTPATTPGQLPPVGYWTVVTIIGLVIALVGQLAVIRLAIGSRQTVGEAIRHGAGRAPAYLAATLMWVLPFLVVAVLLASKTVGDPQARSPVAALALILVCGIVLFFAIRMMMTSPVASAESIGPVAILRRSWELTSGHWLRLFGFFLIFVIGAIVAIIAAQTLSGIVAELLFGGTRPFTIGALFVALIVQITSAAVSVLLMVMLARIYVQLAGIGAKASVPTSGT